MHFFPITDASMREPIQAAYALGAGRPPAHRLSYLLCWPVAARRTRVLAVGLIFLIGATVGLFYAHLAVQVWTGTKPLNDFFALWSWSAMLHTTVHPVALYAPAQVQAFLHAQDPAFKGNYPFAYPPSFLLVIWPLELLPRNFSYWLWVLTTLACYLAVVGQRPWRRIIVVLLVFAPATALTVSAGQNGFLTAALMIGGCRLLDRRPLLAGVLFGLLSCKPQLGVLIPVALLAARQWRAIAAAAVTVLASVVASAAAFGWTMWAQWMSALVGLFHLVGKQTQLYHEMPTIAANLHALGIAPVAVQAAQVAAGIAAGAAVFVCWRRGGTSRLTSAALQAGTFLATPYAFVYDLPLVTNAVMELVLERLEAQEAFSITEVLVAAGSVLLPVAMAMSHGSIPWSGFVLPPLFVVIVRRALLRHRAVDAPGGRVDPVPQRAG